MHNLIKWKRLPYGVVPLTFIAAAFLLITVQASEEKTDWPSLTMTYEVTNQGNLETRRLTYISRDSWTEEVTAANPVETTWGTFSAIGSYQMVEHGQYITYDSVTDSTESEEVSEGVIMIPRLRLTPFPIAVIKENYDQELTKVPTTTKVCFLEECQENAQGWRLVDNGMEYIYADDARGIPLKIGGFVVREVQVSGSREALVSEAD